MNGGHVFGRVADPPVAARAEGCTIWDTSGRAYLDAAGGAIANSIGHGHPAVAAAMARQATTVDYVHASQFTTQVLEDYATRLATRVPVADLRLFPVSGGSEANETAIKLARSYHLARGDERRHLILARSAAYHGNTRAALDASDRAGLVRGYEPWLGQTVRAPAAQPYRDPRSGEAMAAATEAVIVEVGADRVAAFLAEPVSGATLGAAVPPPDYWPAMADVCRRHGVLLILDEVMTGFGRTGTWFAADHWGLRPDIVTCGKGASSGYWPLGLCLVSGEVHAVAHERFVHGFTWSHHPIGAAVATAVLDVLERDDLVAAAATKGEHLRHTLQAAFGSHPHVGDVRGLGLLHAVELVADRSSKVPFPRAAATTERVVAACAARGLIVYPCTSAVDGAVGDAVLLGPPLSVTVAELDEMVERLAAAVADVLPA